MPELEVWGQRQGARPEPKHEKNLRKELRKAGVRHDLSIGTHGGVHAKCSDIAFDDLNALSNMLHRASIEVNVLAFGHPKLSPGKWHATANLERTIKQPLKGDAHHPDAAAVAVSISQESHSNLAHIHIVSKTKPGAPEERILSIKAHSPHVAEELVQHYRDAIQELLTHALASLGITSPISDTEVTAEQGKTH